MSAKGFDHSAVEAVKARLDLAEIVRRYVDLQRRGGRWWGPCPFHQETKGSFSILPEGNAYYCFGCQAAGDVIDFYCRINGLEFKEGLSQLAEEAGVNLSTHAPNPKELAEQDFKRASLKMYALAAQYFQEGLKGPSGEVCRAYLDRRKISQTTIERFKLGWSGPDWHGLETFLSGNGFAKDKAAEAGLLSKNEKGNIYDRFRERLIFPIENLSNQVIAFGGRVLNSGEPKYINSSDSAIYKKGDHLYGLAQARRAISQHKRALLTEGYVDVLTLHQFGYENACGVLGTALTPNQVQRLGGFCSSVDLIFDGDVAGRKAALRSSEMLLARGLKCRVLLMPQGEDVDSLLQGQGREAFEQVLAEARDGLDFCTRTLMADASPKEIMEWAKAFIGKLSEPELVAFYVPRLADGFKVSEQELRQALPGAQQAAAPTGGRRREPRKPAPVPTRGNVATTLEKQILEFAIRNPEFFPHLEAHGAAALLGSQRAGQLWEKIRERDATGAEPHLDTAQKRFWVQCQLERPLLEGNKEQELADIIRFMAVYREQKATRRVGEALRQVGGADRTEERKLLQALQDSLRRNDE
ncbi:MAG: DNA primase [Desulfovibrionaceae bacterium]